MYSLLIAVAAGALAGLGLRFGGVCGTGWSITAGVQAGRTAGMRVIGVDRNKHVQQDFAGCEWLVHDLSELDADVVFGDADER